MNSSGREFKKIFDIKNIPLIFLSSYLILFIFSAPYFMYHQLFPFFTPQDLIYFSVYLTPFLVVLNILFISIVFFYNVFISEILWEDRNDFFTFGGNFKFKLPNIDKMKDLDSIDYKVEEIQVKKILKIFTVFELNYVLPAMCLSILCLNLFLILEANFTNSLKLFSNCEYVLAGLIFFAPIVFWVIKHPINKIKKYWTRDFLLVLLVKFAFLYQIFTSILNKYPKTPLIVAQLASLLILFVYLKIFKIEKYAFFKKQDSKVLDLFLYLWIILCLFPLFPIMINNGFNNSSQHIILKSYSTPFQSGLQFINNGGFEKIFVLDEEICKKHKYSLWMGKKSKCEEENCLKLNLLLTTSESFIVENEFGYKFNLPKKNSYFIDKIDFDSKKTTGEINSCQYY